MKSKNNDTCMHWPAKKIGQIWWHRKQSFKKLDVHRMQILTNIAYNENSWM